MSYFDLPGISATAIKAGATSMLHMRYASMQPSKPPTPAMQLGTIVHAAVLEPVKLPAMIAIWDGPKTGKGWKEYKAENADSIITTTEEMDKVGRMAASVRRNAQCAELIAGCDCEQVLQWEDAAYGPARAKADAIKAGVVIDVKTSRTIDQRSFERQALALGYDLQVGWYLEGAEKCGYGSNGDFWLIVVESSPPFDVMPLRCGYDVIMRGQERAIDIATRYYQCCLRGEWPGVCGEQSDRVWSLPQWALEESDEQDISTGTMEASEL
jgi:hypothetical protein